MSFVPPTGWVPQQYLGGLDQQPLGLPLPEWADQATWDRAQQEAQALLSGGAARGYNQGVLRTLSAAQQSGDITPLVNAIAAQYTEGPTPFGNQSLSRGIVNAGIIGSGVGSVLTNLPSAAATGATTYPYVAGGPITGSAIPGVTSATTAANAAAAGIGAGAAVAPGVVGGGGGAAGLNWTTLVPSLVSGVTGVLGANAQADAAGDAARLSREMFDIARADALPRIEAGNRAVGVLDQVQGLTTGTPDMSRFYTSPDYQFNLAEGTKAGERALSSMGLRNSGAAVKEAGRYASGLASREYGSFVDRLLATAGLSTTGAAQSAAAGTANASIGGNAIQNRGAARSSGYSAVNDAVQGGVGNYLLQQYLNRNPVYG